MLFPLDTHLCEGDSQALAAHASSTGGCSIQAGVILTSVLRICSCTCHIGREAVLTWLYTLVGHFASSCCVLSLITCRVRDWVCLLRPFQCVVIQQLLYEVHVRHEHAPTAVAGEAKRIQGIPAQDRPHQVLCGKLTQSSMGPHLIASTMHPHGVIKMLTLHCTQPAADQGMCPTCFR